MSKAEIKTQDEGKARYWVGIKLCPTHNQLNLSYLKWHEEAERRMKKGMKQKQCPICKRWLWKDEM